MPRFQIQSVDYEEQKDVKEPSSSARQSVAYPLDVLYGVLATLWGRYMLFMSAIVVGLNLASLWCRKTLVGPMNIGESIATSSLLSLISFRFFVINFLSIVAVVFLALSESLLAVCLTLTGTVALWCWVGWSLWG